MLGLASSAQPASSAAKKVAAVGRFQPPKAGERASRRTNSEVRLAAISKARRPKPKGAAVAAVAAAPAPVTACIWAQCDACDKWRRVETAPAEGARWECSMLAGLTCEVPEEVIEKEAEHEIGEAAEQPMGGAAAERIEQSGQAATSTQGAPPAPAPAPAPAPDPAAEDPAPSATAEPTPWADTPTCVPAPSPHTAALVQAPLPAGIGAPAER